jgi:hypothetical protein
VTSQQPRAFFALDLGSATTSVALIGHVGGRWRLVGHTSTPRGLGSDALLTALLQRVDAADPDILADLGAPPPLDLETLAAAWPRFTSSTTPPRRIAILAGSRRQRHKLESVARRSGWRIVSGSADDTDILELERLILSRETQAVLLGADGSPAGDERRNLPDLAEMVAAATRLRPELMIVLAGGAAAYESVFFAPGMAAPPPPEATSLQVTVPAPQVSGDAVERAADKTEEQSKVSTEETGEPAPDSDAGPSGEAAGPGEQLVGRGPGSGTVAASAPGGSAPDAPAPGTSASAAAAASGPAPVATAAPTPDNPVAHVLLAPDAEAGSPQGSSLQQVLEGLRAEPGDSRLGIARSVATLAYVLDRSIEAVEVGLQAGLIARSEPFGSGHFSIVSSHACLVDGSFAPADPSDEVIDGLAAWSTQALDRHRLTDQLVDLRVAPWGNADGDGAIFRLAAAKAALARLLAAVPEVGERPMPELLIAAGGILSSLPAPIVALGLADIIRRPGITQVASDPARLLGPLGTIEDEAERRRLIANLADDILLPVGSLVIPGGVKPGKSAGHLRLQGTAYISEIELHPGAIQVVDLPGGRAATADLEFRDTVRLAGRGHHFSMQVSGGLAGLLVDLRDVPMRISDRPETRRAALDAWQKGMWPEVDE